MRILGEGTGKVGPKDFVGRIVLGHVDEEEAIEAPDGHDSVVGDEINLGFEGVLGVDLLLLLAEERQLVVVHAVHGDGVGSLVV